MSFDPEDYFDMSGPDNDAEVFSDLIEFDDESDFTMYPPLEENYPEWDDNF